MFGKMPQWRLFKIWGHEIFMEPAFLFLIAIFAFMGVGSLSQLISGLLIAPILFFGIIWHELGHALTTKKMGYGHSRIVLQGMGGVAISQRPVNTPPKKAALISVMGPLFSLSITVVFGAIAYFVPMAKDSYMYGFIMQMAVLNLYWGIFNLLPVNPLDGGHIMLAGFRGLFKNDKKAYLYTAYISLAFLAVIAIFAYSYFGFMGALIAVMVGYSNIEIIKQLS